MSLIRKWAFLSILLATYGLVLAGCFDFSPHEIPVQEVNVPFDSSEAAPFRKAGTSKIIGSAKIQISADNNEWETCAGKYVTLVPDTKYTRKAISILASGAYPIRDGQTAIYFLDPRLANVNRRQKCGVNGEFEFKNLPVGDWLLLGPWEYPSSYMPIQFRKRPFNDKCLSAVLEIRTVEGQETLVELKITPYRVCP